MFKFALLHFFLLSICVSRCMPQPEAAATADTVYVYQKGAAGGSGKWYMGREIAQVMGAGGAAWLERNEREKEERTTLSLGAMHVRANDVIADIGAGSGYYTFKLASLVPDGKVYATDVQPEMIEMLLRRKQREKQDNVVVVTSSEQNTNLAANSIDIALMVDVYHELSYPHEVLQSVKKALTATGKLILIEYRGEDPSIPIKPLHKMTTAQAQKELSANGFLLVSDSSFLPLQHFLVFHKQINKIP